MSSIQTTTTESSIFTNKHLSYFFTIGFWFLTALGMFLVLVKSNDHAHFTAQNFLFILPASLGVGALLGLMTYRRNPSRFAFSERAKFMIKFALFDAALMVYIVIYSIIQ